MEASFLWIPCFVTFLCSGCYAVTTCGGTLREPRGVITTPNFPDPYPVPIACKWVIEAPSDKVIAVYFTQFYMREGFRATEYAFYSEAVSMGKTDFGVVSSEQEPTYLVSNKPVLVLDFAVKELGNIHMRIREFFLDVYGFNITYETLNKSQAVRQDACIYHHCSFTGNCFSNSNLTQYSCDCFPEYYGTECQYSPGCGPMGKSEMCLNGGTCRYYIGSTVRTCECPSEFSGARCEKKKDSSLDCLPLRCSHACSQISATEFQCSCPAGFYLSDDKQSCAEEGRTKYWIYFRLYDHNIDLEHLDPSRSDQLKKGVESALLSLLKKKLYKVDNLTVLEFQNEGLVKFRFYGEKEDYHQAKIIMEEALKRGRIGKYAVNKTYIHIDWEPALSIQRVESSENMPLVEGTEISLACIVQGSNDLQINWLKDNHPINFKTPYRSLWTTLVPKNSKDQYTALLGLDSIHILDAGEFTCQVMDGGMTLNKSIHLETISAPKPRITPLTATVMQGEDVVITCLSQDDVYGNFGYNWLKNGKILNPTAGPEMVEDLFPTGSRVLIKAAKSSAVYTCIITSTAGSTHKDSIITVISATEEGEIVPMCQAEEYVGVKWHKAAANTVDIQICPIGYTGDVSRKCMLVNGVEAAWEEPVFSNCLSARFLEIKQSFESIRVGYLLTTVNRVLHTLYEWLTNAVKLHAGEGEPIVDFLGDVVHYQIHQPELIHSLYNNTELILNSVAFLLDSSFLVQRQSYIVKLHHHLLDSGLLLGRFSEVGTFISLKRAPFVLEVGKFYPSKIHKPKFPHSESPSWLSEVIELTLEPSHIPTNESVTIAAIFYKNLSSFLPQLFLSKMGTMDMQYQLHSQPLGIALMVGDRRLEALEPPSKLRIKMAHLHQTDVSSNVWNISCGLADFSSEDLKFQPESCQLRFTHNFSVCQCQTLGTYSVLLTAFSSLNGDYYKNSFDLIVGIGSGIAAFFSCLTLLLLIILWRKVPGAITALKIQVCVSLIGTYFVFLKAIHKSLHQDCYPYVISLLLFFLLVAFTLQLCIALIVYIEFTGLKSIHFPEAKLAAIGWVVPVIVLGATLAAQVLEGFYLQSWWLTIGSNYFYAYNISSVVIVLLQLILYLTVKAEISHHQKARYHSYNLILTRTKLLNRSLIITCCLICVSVTSILYVNYQSVILYKYLFSCSSALLGVALFCCYTLCSEKAHILCSSQASDLEKDDELGKSGSNSFKSFLKPEMIGDGLNCIDKPPDPDVIEKRMARVSHMRYQIEKVSQDMDWSDLDQLFHSKAKASKRPEIQKGSLESRDSWAKYEEFENSPAAYNRWKAFQKNLPPGSSGPAVPLSASVELQPINPAYFQTLPHRTPIGLDIGDGPTFRTLPHQASDCDPRALNEVYPPHQKTEVPPPVQILREPPCLSQEDLMTTSLTKEDPTSTVVSWNTTAV